MKRLWAAVIILIFLLFICSVGSKTTVQSTSQMTSQLNTLKAEVSKHNTATALAMSQDIIHRWNHEHSILCMYISHEHIEQIDQTLSVLPAYIQNDSYDAFQAECDRACLLIRRLNDTEQLSLENFL